MKRTVWQFKLKVCLGVPWTREDDSLIKTKWKVASMNQLNSSEGILMESLTTIGSSPTNCRFVQRTCSTRSCWATWRSGSPWTRGPTTGTTSWARHLSLRATSTGCSTPSTAAWLILIEMVGRKAAAVKKLGGVRSTRRMMWIKRRLQGMNLLIEVRRRVKMKVMRKI